MTEPSYRALYPRQMILITTAGTYREKRKDNISTLAWSTPTSVRPELVAISVNNSSLSFDFILETEEFVINIPSIEMKDKVLFCGTASGRTADKFTETGFPAILAEKVKPKLIKECIANIECELSGSIKTGDHTLFIGEIVAIRRNSENKQKTLIDLGGRNFIGL